MYFGSLNIQHIICVSSAFRIDYVYWAVHAVDLFLSFQLYKTVCIVVGDTTVCKGFPISLLDGQIPSRQSP